jgi:signal transduction histidine kinase
VTVIFAREMSAFRASVLEWAGSDLFSRTKVAVSTLEEPLRTGDFAAVHAFNRQCAADGVRLSIFGKPKGGLVFDSLGGFTDVLRDSDYIYGTIEDAGAFEVMLGLPLDRVLAPYRRAKTSLVLAALVGIAGMFFVFFALYHQRARIRELARTEKFRREFVADVSHEIKTPLTGILGAAEMLSEGDASEAQKPLLSMISKESTRLNALVQQILDLARLEREGEALDLAETDLVDLARESVDLMRPRAEAAGIALSFAAPDAPCIAKVDARLLSEALLNLVENAIRHSGSPDIAVSVSVSGHRATFVVEDHGIGIPPEHAERVFERFHRVDPARAAETGGAGLGLAIARRIARLHGGDVVLSPVVPSGSRFSLSIGCRQ